MDGWMGVWMDGWMDGGMNESMGRWIIGFFIRISCIILHTFTSDLNLPQATHICYILWICYIIIKKITISVVKS